MGGVMANMATQWQEVGESLNLVVFGSAEAPSPLASVSGFVRLGEGSMLTCVSHMLIYRYTHTDAHKTLNRFLAPVLCVDNIYMYKYLIHTVCCT